MPDRGALDETDLQIVAALRQDGRMPVLEIARMIDIPESTVRKRLQRLLSQQLVRVVAVPSTQTQGYKREVTFAIIAERGKALDVAQQLARAEPVQFVAFGIGAFDLMVNTVFRADEDIFQFVTEWLAVDGIASYQSMDIMAVFRRTDDWVVHRELTCRSPVPALPSNGQSSHRA